MERIEYTPNTEKFNPNNRKENSAMDSAIIAIRPDGTHIIEARWYYPNTVCYCAVWIHSTETLPAARGTGKAGGGGYDKRSAAFDEAIRNCGVKFFDRENDSPMSVVEAIARYITGDDSPIIVHTNC